MSFYGGPQRPGEIGGFTGQRLGHLTSADGGYMFKTTSPSVSNSSGIGMPNLNYQNPRLQAFGVDPPSPFVGVMMSSPSSRIGSSNGSLTGIKKTRRRVNLGVEVATEMVPTPYDEMPRNSSISMLSTSGPIMAPVDPRSNPTKVVINFRTEFADEGRGPLSSDPLLAHIKDAAPNDWAKRYDSMTPLELATYTGRPANQFIHYRVDKAAKACEWLRIWAANKTAKEIGAGRKTKKWKDSPSNPDVCALLGASWAKETPDVKKIYEVMAKQEKAKHAELFPSYRYAPSARSKKVAKGRNGAGTGNRGDGMVPIQHSDGNFISEEYAWDGTSSVPLMYPGREYQLPSSASGAYPTPDSNGMDPHNFMSSASAQSLVSTNLFNGSSGMGMPSMPPLTSFPTPVSMQANYGMLMSSLPQLESGTSMNFTTIQSPTPSTSASSQVGRGKKSKRFASPGRPHLQQPQLQQPPFMNLMSSVPIIGQHSSSPMASPNSVYDGVSGMLPFMRTTTLPPLSSDSGSMALPPVQYSPW